MSARNCPAASTAASGASHIGDNGVSIVRGDKVLDLARRRGCEVVAADEVRRKIELGRIGARGAIGRAIDFLLCSSSHVVCRNAHTPRVAVVERGSSGGGGESGKFGRGVARAWSLASRQVCRSQKLPQVTMQSAAAGD
jgi:hypothetical protein